VAAGIETEITMTTLERWFGLALCAAFTVVIFGMPADAGDRGVRQAKTPPARHRVAHRVQTPLPAAPAGAPVMATDPRIPYGGAGRAQFDPITVGPQPDRSEGRSPEGP
jgi:hypothetical protein